MLGEHGDLKCYISRPVKTTGTSRSSATPCSTTAATQKSEYSLGVFLFALNERCAHVLDRELKRIILYLLPTSYHHPRVFAPPIALCIPCLPRHFRYLAAVVGDAQRQTAAPAGIIVVASEMGPETAQKIERELSVCVLETPYTASAGGNRNRCTAAPTSPRSSTPTTAMHPQRLELAPAPFSVAPRPTFVLHSYQFDDSALDEDPGERTGASIALFTEFSKPTFNFEEENIKLKRGAALYDHDVDNNRDDGDLIETGCHPLWPLVRVELLGARKSVQLRALR